MRLGIFFSIGLAGCGVELEHGLDERQANQIAALLDQAGIRADKQGQDDAFTIVVPRGELARAVQTLEARDLPRPRVKAPSASSLLPSPLEEKTRFAAAEAARLEATLETLPQVTVARVHLALPPEELLPGDPPRVRPTASVLLKAHGEVSIPAVQQLVARAVSSMQPADVAVLITPGPADAAPALEHFGPLRVARESRPTLATLATSGLVLIALLALGLVFAALRLAALRRRLRNTA